jgi:hypothetical protein
MCRGTETKTRPTPKEIRIIGLSRERLYHAALAKTASVVNSASVVRADAPLISVTLNLNKSHAQLVEPAVSAASCENGLGETDPSREWRASVGFSNEISKSKLYARDEMAKSLKCNDMSNTKVLLVNGLADGIKLCIYPVLGLVGDFGGGERCFRARKSFPAKGSSAGDRFR